MDNLKEIISLMPEEACKEFKVFTNRRKKKSDRKDLELFELMREKDFKKPAEYLSELYTEDAKTNAYHALRKRLFKHLLSFLVLQRMDTDNTGASLIMGKISLIKYLFEQGNERLAWLYLTKGEKLAIENEQYDLLNTIYKLQIENAESEFAQPLVTTIIKREKYKKIAEEEEASIIAFSLIKQRLNEVKLQGKYVDFDTIITRTLAEFQISNRLHENPKYLYNILAITRSAILAKKDFHSFEPYAIKQYRLLSQKGIFNKTNHLYKLNILYMICHVLYRNRKFEKAVEYLEVFNNNLQDLGHIYRRKFYTKYIMLLAATKSYLGKGNEAIMMLEQALQEITFLKDTEQLGIILNLGLYYFQQNDIKKANYTSVRLGHTDQWYRKKMGAEWTMKKNLMEIIIQYELGNMDILMSMLNSFETNYKDLFEQPMYSRVKMYIDLIRKMAEQPEMVNPKTLDQLIKPNLIQMPEEQEDLQAMTFYSWLKAKFLKRGFYEVLLETVA